jgi:hypothetical protein
LTSNSENERIDLYISKNVSDMSRNSIRNPWKKSKCHCFEKPGRIEKEFD